MISKLIHLIASAAFALVLLGITYPVFAQEPPPAPEATATPESWLILPELPETATQADVGAEIYRLVCKDCHGDRGQGLTADWIAEWDPDDQNCWQSKCHAGPIPRGGFALPRFVPAIVGSDTLLRFATAHTLYDFIRQNMPWHAPGSLQDYEYMQLTAYLLRENGLETGAVPLDETTAASFLLRPEVAAVTSTPEAPATAPAAAPAGASSWYVLAIAAVVGFSLVLGVRLLWKR